MSAESPRHIRSGGPLTVPSQPPADRSLIDAVSGFINDVKLTSATVDPKDVIQWARFETADINEPTPEGDSDNDISPLLLILGYGTGVQVWLIPPNGEAQEVLSWRQGTVRVLRILPTPTRGDCFTVKRPLIALCDSASPGPPFCSLSFISIRGGEQVKSIKFKNPILDVLANKRSVVVSFSERFAVFDAGTLEDRMAVTTCYPCPCPLGGTAPINPLALGDRWLAYADKKLNPSKRSSGGCEGEGQASYTATVLHAAKSLSKGLRGLGESVAHSLAGTRAASQSPSPPHADHLQPGVVTVIDIEVIEEEDGQDAEEPSDPIVAHFVAHSEAIIALKFDSSGMVLVTADRRGHDFHVFRINPHPCGPALASVHHLYVLHRGDTTAKVQDIALSGDCRWAAVSSLRGTTHVFALSPYGGAVGVRTHTAPRVVNRLSRFHRSAGLPIHAPPHRAPPPPPASPVSGGGVGGVGGGECVGGGCGAWFPNPRLPPFPAPAHCSPLAQLRPTANLATHTITRTSSGRQRLSSLSEDNNSAPLLARAAWGAGGVGGAARGGGAPHSLYLMTASGCLTHLVLHPRPATGVPKEKISDDSPIELEVEPIAQWPLQRPPAAADLLAPLPPSNPLLQPLECRRCSDMCLSEEERWLAQVEIVTHAGPHRRLWMGPQFVFKTYNCTGSNSSLSEAETVEVEGGVARSNPVNMPGVRPAVPVLIDSGSASSLEHSPSDSFRRKSLLAETGRANSVCDVQLREDLAEAMKEDHGSRRAGKEGAEGEEGETGEEEAGGRGVELAVDPSGTVVRAVAGVAPAAADPDEYTRANQDETTFRPVVRAPAALPPAELPARPLPRTTTIPVQSLPPHPLHPLHPPHHVAIPARDALSAFLAADARLQRQIDDARQDLPLPTRASRNDEQANDSSVVKKCDPAPVVAERSIDVAATIEDSMKIVDYKLQPEKVVIQTREASVEPETKSKKEVLESKTNTSEIAESTPKKCVGDETEPMKVQSVSLEDAPVEVKIKMPSKMKEGSEPKVTSEAVKPKSELSSKKEPSNKHSLENKHSDSKVSKVDIEEIKSVKDKKLDSKCLKYSTKETNEKKKKENADSKKCISDTKTVTKQEVSQTKKEATETKTCTKEVIPEIKTSKTEVIEVQKEKVCETKPNPEESVDSKLSVKQDLPEITLPVKEDLPETKLKNKEGSPKLKTITKRVSCERERSPKKETKELKSAWKKDSPKLDWSLKTEPFEKMVISKNEPSVSRSLQETVEIKTEEQAWDMLNEPEKEGLNASPQSAASDEVNKSDETKTKSKKNRKIKKSQDDPQNKSEDDSFVEIHAIEEKIQPSSGELVSISIPFEEIESSSSYSSKTKKSRSPKNTADKKEQSQPKLDDWLLEEIDCTIKLKNSTRKKSITPDIEILPEYDAKTKCNELKTEISHTINIENTDIAITEAPVLKDKKTKSMTPNQDSRKSIDKSLDIDVKDVYVIDSTKDEFPEIQITSSRGSKARKKSPLVEKNKKSEEIEVITEKPNKSWSSIAACKNSKKSDEDIEKKLELKNTEKKVEIATDYQASSTYKFERKEKSRRYPIEDEPSSPISLHEELMRLCKRTDIMVAQCDAPSGLNFVDKHHSLLQDLPPLELDFGLDDFRLEVMRDSLLDVNETQLNSPICKINIDSILSSIKESTSAFNLIDLEKVPDKKEKGFSVVENDKITSQEVKADDDSKSEDKEIEGMEKSSDDDNASPVLSADSDKEDKKSNGASNVTLPSSKQSSRSKKSRRKKK